MKLKLKQHTLLWGSVGMLGLHPLSAALIFHEPFSESAYPAAWEGTTPDVGGDAWAAGQGTNEQVNVEITDVSIDTTGTQALTATGGKLSLTAEDEYRGYSVLSGGGLGGDGTSVYLSTLIDLTDTDINGQATGLDIRKNSPTDATHSTNRVLFIGAIGTNYAVQTQVGAGSVALGPGVNFVVTRFNFVAGNDTIDVWVNPTAADLTGPADGQLTGAEFDFDHVAISTFGNFATGTLDEIRIGTELTDVALVPEPSSTALLGLGGLALILRRRRS